VIHRRRGPDAADLLLGAIPLLCLFPLRNNDLWWHLAAGRAMVETGGFLYGDPFSFTHYLSPWVNNEWLSQLLFYTGWRIAGAWGLIVLRACLYTAIFLVLRSWLREGRQPGALLPCLVVGIALSYGWWELRPSTLSIVLTLALLVILERARRSGRGLALLPVLFSPWASLHPGFLFGLCILVATAAAVAAERFVPGWRRWSAQPALARRLAGWTAVSAAVTLVNPYGWNVYRQQIEITHNAPYRALLDEWVPPSVPYLALVIATVIAFAVLRGRRVPLAAWVPILGAAALSMTGVRFEEYFALVAVPAIFVHLGVVSRSKGRMAFVAALLAASVVVGLRPPLAVSGREGRADGTAFDPVETRLGHRLAWNAGLLTLVIAGAAIAASKTGRSPSRSRTRWAAAGAGLALTAALGPVLLKSAVERDRYPSGCLDALSRDDRTFNRLSWGGFILWTRRVPTFIDGRCSGQPLFFEYARAYGPAWREVFDAHAIDAAVVARGDALETALSVAEDWRQVCTDPVAAVYRRR